MDTYDLRIYDGELAHLADTSKSAQLLVMQERLYIPLEMYPPARRAKLRQAVNSKPTHPVGMGRALKSPFAP